MVFDKGDTVVVTAEVTNESDQYIEANSCVCSIIQPNGTELVTEAVMTRDAIGKYHYDFDIPDTYGGMWQSKCKIMIGSRKVKTKADFVVN